LILTSLLQRWQTALPLLRSSIALHLSAERKSGSRLPLKLLVLLMDHYNNSNKGYNNAKESNVIGDIYGNAATEEDAERFAKQNELQTK
jgi:hypothetical protein